MGVFDKFLDIMKLSDEDDYEDDFFDDLIWRLHRELSTLFPVQHLRSMEIFRRYLLTSSS